MTTVTLDPRELAAVLAGLRLVQRELPRSEFLPQGVHDIFDDGGTIQPLDEDEIDALCETINCAPTTQPQDASDAVSLRDQIVSDLFDTCRSDDDYLRTLLADTVNGWSSETARAYADEYLNPDRAVSK